MLPPHSVDSSRTLYLLLLDRSQIHAHRLALHARDPLFSGFFTIVFFFFLILLLLLVFLPLLLHISFSSTFSSSTTVSLYPWLSPSRYLVASLLCPLPHSKEAFLTISTIPPYDRPEYSFFPSICSMFILLQQIFFFFFNNPIRCRPSRAYSTLLSASA